MKNKTNYNNMDSLILAIDTSCDETSVAILKGRRVLVNIVSSQVELHRKWGGVVPDIARRAHIENLPKAVDEAFKRAKLEVKDLDAISATRGPGLAIDLEIGLNFAKELSIKHNKPFIPVNHMEGHLLSSLILNSEGNGVFDSKELGTLFPSMGLLVSGKHTELVYVTNIGIYNKVGKTLDDAAGEAFDKFGRMLGFGYPGGPIVSEFAKRGGPVDTIQLPVPMQHSGDLNFSYSGLKTSCLYKINTLREEGVKDKEFAADFSYAFIDSVIKSLLLKLGKSFKEYPDVKSVLAGGGVYNSPQVARAIGNFVRRSGRVFLLPDKKYRSDNAAMIGLVAGFSFARGEYLTEASEIEDIDRIPRLSL